MDTLVIQDSFEPYYSGRNRPAAPTSKELLKRPGMHFKTDANRIRLPVDSSAKINASKEH